MPKKYLKFILEILNEAHSCTKDKNKTWNINGLSPRGVPHFSSIIKEMESANLILINRGPDDSFIKAIPTSQGDEFRRALIQIGSEDELLLSRLKPQGDTPSIAYVCEQSLSIFEDRLQGGIV